MKSLVISLHDVSPLTQAVTELILDELAALGIGQTSLLIIPDHHRRAPICKNPDFQSWIAEKIRKGHEPVLHGYFHERKKRPGQSWRAKMVTEVYTAGEGEFFDLSEAEARDRLERGLTDLEFLRKEISGFIAPAWLLGTEAEKAVQAVGFQYTTRIDALQLFRNRTCVRSRSLVWSTRSCWRIWASLRWNQLLAGRVRDHDLIRIGIHPPDYEQPAVWQQIKRLISELKANRECVSYQTFVEGQIERLP